MSSALDDRTGEVNLPLHSEEVSVSRRQVSGDRVQVRTVTHTRDRLIDEELAHERVEVERVPIGRMVTTAPPVREEGDTTIIPVVKEIVVVERRLMLTEEVRVRRVRVAVRHVETVPVREQEAVVTRVEAGSQEMHSDDRRVEAGPTKIAEEQQT